MFLATSSAISPSDDTAGDEHRANTFHGPHSTGFKQCTVSEPGGALNIFRVVPWVRKWRRYF